MAFSKCLSAPRTRRARTFYKREVLPVLSEYCYDCHGDGAHKGDVVLDKFKSYPDMLKDRKFWDGVREHVTTHVMPPEKKPKPTLEQRDVIVRWIDDAVMAVDPGRPDPGHIMLRRLNRAEYNNTIRDIFKIESRPADRFPTDDSGYGFDNIGDVLSLSPILMEKYLRAAHEIVQQSIWARPADRIVIEKHGGKFFGSAGNSAETRRTCAGSTQPPRPTPLWRFPGRQSSASRCG